MPTPVTTARQCLTEEAAHALDEAVNVARRRGHGQTTSLHAVSALLSLPSSPLRDACARARNSAYSPRLQFKALELCLGVSLDRVPTSQLSDDSPPVSNSLMAAIKRSQANQRRQPENFNLYHQIQQQQQQSSSSISCIKVELQNLILSILDDPVVSRVFGEAGFRSSEIKLAIVRPLPQVFKFSSSRFKGPPLFLCNLLSSEDPDSLYSGPGRRGVFSFPFSGGLFLNSNSNIGDANCGRIGEVLARKKGRNPLLVGLSAYHTLASFSEMVEKRKENVLPVELCGLSFICIESDVNKFITSENFDKKCVDLKFEEMGQSVEKILGPGLLVNFGDLKAFVSNDDHNNGLDDAVSYVIEKLTKLLQLYGGRVWLIGAASYENYSKFVGRFPSTEKDWDLHLLPITFLRTSSVAESYPRSSLMESFVPFGGFFSTPSDLNVPLNRSCQYLNRCHLCNEKCEQEILSVSKGGFLGSVADQFQSSLPSWMQMAEIGTNKGLDVKIRDDGMVLSTKVAGLQRKWDSICQRLHHTQPPGSNTHPPQLPIVTGFQLIEDEKEDAENFSSKDTSALPHGNRCVNLNSHIPSDTQNTSRKQLGFSFPVVSEARSDSILFKQWGKPSKEEDLESSGLRSPYSFSNSCTVDGSQASPTSVTSVTTDLGLRISSDLSGSFSANVDIVHGSISDHQAQSPSSSSPVYGGQFDPSNAKMLFRAVAERVGRQDEAIRIISQTIAHCRARNQKRQGANLRGDIWFSFCGPDRCGKKKIASAFAEIIYGSRENFISADLSSQDGMAHNHMVFDCPELSGHTVKFRGKTVVDFVAGELCKKPLSIVFLENIEKADVQAQKSLSHAIQTGKFADSHGREVGISNAIFVTTSTLTEDKVGSSSNDFSTYSEERILRTKGWPMKILIERAPDEKMGQIITPITVNKDIPSSIFLNKRKMVGANQNLDRQEITDMVKRAHKTSARNLDLNLPAVENDLLDTDDGNSYNDPASDNSKAWLHDFLEQLDARVFFKPFDFDALAERILNEVNGCFHKIARWECVLDIDPKVMEQLLAASYLSDQDNVVQDWVEQVLGWGFVEVLRRYGLSANSIVKLVACKGLFLEGRMPGVYLPTKIIIN
ncbi:protein SMAX [Salix suchowensis]|nr:protein SMAX [Salix suchowensis]